MRPQATHVLVSPEGAAGSRFGVDVPSEHSTVRVQERAPRWSLTPSFSFTARSQFGLSLGPDSTDEEAPATGTAVDVRLRAALRRAQTAEGSEYLAEWADEVSAAIYIHGVTAVRLLREYWREGSLRGEALGECLTELGYGDEPSSQSERRSLLVDALSSLDAEVRHAAAQGLLYLGDSSALDGLLRAKGSEPNRMVRAEIEDAIEALGVRSASR